MEPKYQNGDVLMVVKPITVTKYHPDAVDIGDRENFDDPYWVLPVVTRFENRVDDVLNDVNEFGTGLSLRAPKHYHLEIIEHPQLHKAGYSLVGGPRIITPAAAEQEIVLPLMKFREGDDISLPFEVAIVVMRETQYGTTTVFAPKKEKVRYVEETNFLSSNSRAAAPAKEKGRAKKGNHFF